MGAKNRQGLLRRTTGGKRMTPRKPKIVAEVPVTSHADGDAAVIGSARVEQLSRDNFIYHVDASGMSAEQLRRGLSFGAFTVPEEPGVQLEKQLDR